jgi:hypothetical protein
VPPFVWRLASNLRLLTAFNKRFSFRVETSDPPTYATGTIHITKSLSAYNGFAFCTQGEGMPRILVLLSLAFLLTPVTNANAKDKDKVLLQADVLNAQTILVVITPGAGEPLTDPSANRRAQEDVEKALMKWGRFRLELQSQTADLVIAVRRGTGRTVSPTIHGGPIDDRGVILQPTDGSVRIGAQRGHPPDLNQPGLGTPQDAGPRIQTEVGASEDTFEVYRGGLEYPLDSPPVWRYIANDALRSPAVPAVEQFRKALEEAQKAATQKQGKKKP